MKTNIFTQISPAIRRPLQTSILLRGSVGPVALAAIFLCAAPASVQAQIGNNFTDNSPTIDTDVSSLIATGCGYDAWTGSVRRHVVDFQVAGSSLKWERTYNSSSGRWSFAYTYQMLWRPYYQTENIFYPDGRQSHFEVGTKERLFNRPDPNNPNNHSDTTYGFSDVYLGDGSIVHFDHVTQRIGEPDQQKPTYQIVDSYSAGWMVDRYGHGLGFQWQAVDDYNNRLVSVIDESGRSISIEYNTPTNVIGYLFCPSAVYGSDGQWVKYTWENVTNRDGATVPMLKQADYSDGTSAYYGNAETSWGANGRAQWPVLIWAQDTRATGPMQNIYYEYNTTGRCSGQIQAEHYLTHDGSMGVKVSSLDSTITSNSGAQDTAATQTEHRGDGPTCTIHMQKLNQGAGPPFTTWKTDYYGKQEKFAYDGNFFVKAVTDRNLNTTNFTLEKVIGNPLSRIHPDQTHIDYQYSVDFYPYYLKTVKDENGNLTTYTRNDINAAVNPNMVTQVDYPNDANTPASSERFWYNNFGEVIAHQKRNGAYEYFLYDSSGLQTDATNPTWNYYSDYIANYPNNFPSSEPTTHYSYYGANDPVAGNAWIDRVKQKTPPANAQGLVNSETYEYDRAFASGETNPTGAAVPGRGLVTRITHNWDGSSKTFTYDVYGNKKSEKDELGDTTKYTYDDYMRLQTTTLPDTGEITGGINGYTTNDYTATNGSSPYSHTSKCITTITGPQGCGASHITATQTFDNNLRLASRTEAPGTADAGTTLFGYDYNGNQTSVTDARNNQTIISFDSRNRKTQVTDPGPLSYITKWFYDSASNVTSIQRKDGTIETKTYDAVNRVLMDQVPKDGTAGTPTSYITTHFKYNPSGTLNWVQDGNGNSTYFGYGDPRDLRNRITYQNGDYQYLIYDNDANLVSRGINTQTPNWQTIYQNFKFDGRNRKTEMWWGPNEWDATADLTWANGVEHNTYQYDLVSRLTQASNAFSTVKRQYWEDNRLKSDEQILATGIDKTVLYHYDPAGENIRAHVDDGNGYDRDYCYDARSRFKTIGDHTSHATWFTYGYDPASNVVSRACSLNGVTESVPESSGTTGYDAINRPLEKDQVHAGNTFAYEKYGYDAMSRMTTINREDGKQDTLGYNLDGEITSANYQWQSNRSVSYTLDKAGNRTGVVDAGVTKYYTPDNINRYTTADSATANSGNVTSGPEHQVGMFQGNAYQYVGDSHVAMISAAGVNYTVGYDALGRCVKRTFNSATTYYYLYDGEKPILEYTLSGTTSVIAGKNVYGKGIDEILMRTDYVVNPSGQTYYYQEDHEGSITHVTDGSGNIVESYRYDAFGAPTFYHGPPLPANQVGQSQINNRFLFTGREYIQQFGIYEYRARTYHPGLGRFVSEDPKGFDAGDYNLFRYCHNDPEDLTDPMGLAWSSELFDPLGPNGDPQKHQNTGIRMGRLSASDQGAAGGGTEKERHEIEYRPQMDRNGNQVYEERNAKQLRVYNWEVWKRDSNGQMKRADERGWTNKETLEKAWRVHPDGTKTPQKVENTANESAKSLGPHAVLRDTVGKLGGDNGNYHVVQIFSETAYHGGAEYHSTTKIRSEYGMKDGVRFFESRAIGLRDPDY